MRFLDLVMVYITPGDAQTTASWEQHLEVTDAPTPKSHQRKKSKNLNHVIKLNKANHLPADYPVNPRPAQTRHSPDTARHGPDTAWHGPDTAQHGPGTAQPGNHRALRLHSDTRGGGGNHFPFHWHVFPV